MDCKSIQSSTLSGLISKHDVFISFRGEDTRNNFTDHLFAALQRNGIVTFRDDRKLNKGEPISLELLQAIEGSRISIVVFSKNYAASTWCLQELAKIVDCIKVPGQRVLPVFYDVNPSEVRKQSGNYGKDFVEHEERFKEDLEMVQRWRGALTQVANLSGWDVQNKPQYDEIKKIVQEVTSTLGHKVSSLAGRLVGMQSRVEQLEKLLILGSDNDVRVVGICGMGGIGKTTLASVLYDKVSHQFDVCCFIDDLSKIYEDYGPIGAQKQLLCQTLHEENLRICNISKATYLIRTRLRHVRALIVVDNVDQTEQLEQLAVNRECLGKGSRIIIISRDEHILREHGVDEAYHVQVLEKDKALRLFCRKAFKCDDIIKDYEELTYCALKYAKGLPLAIKVLGSFLFGRDASEWRSALARLRENPMKEIIDVLRISFDGLKEMEKQIFLDIACFFHDESVEVVKNILNCCGFHPDIGMRVLIDKSLITNKKGMIYMHDLLKELGRNIVREKSPNDPGKWSRLWHFKDLQSVMLENTATKNVEAIVQSEDSIKNREKPTLRIEALSQMSNLRLLILWHVNFSGSLSHLSNELGYIEWEKCPLASLPLSFQADKLVELILPHSSIKQLWKGAKLLYNLRNMNLYHSKNLIKLPDFREVPNLELLNLEGCMKLLLIDPSIGVLRKLVSLNLRDCKNLVSIPNNILGLSSLKALNVSGCSKLLNNQLLGKPRHTLKKHDISKTAIQCQSTASMSKMLMSLLRFLNSRRHEDSVGLLVPSLSSFLCLQDLDLSFCNLLQIPNAIGWLHCLESLNLGGNNFVRLPSSFRELSKLWYLNLEHCKQLKYLPELPTVRKRYCSWYGAGLCIFNCPKLGEMERCSSFAFSWMIQVLQAHQDYPFPLRARIDIVFSGTQIPSWFNNQSTGSSISVDPSPIVHDNNWIGVACCAAFHACDDPANLGQDADHGISCGFMNEKRGRHLCIPLLIKMDLVTVESDHLWVLYFTREEFIEIISYITEETLDLNDIELTTHTYDPPGLHLEVKNCGFRWVFKEDLEELCPIMTCSIIQVDHD